MTLQEFIARHRALIITRTRAIVACRVAPLPTEAEITHGVPLFLDQLSARLAYGVQGGPQQLAVDAQVHGGELWMAGLTIGQVVHDYGDICQAITGLAIELDWQISNDEFQTLNLCLDVAIEGAVTEYARRRESQIVGEGVEHLGFLAHELRNLLNTATLAFEAVRSGDAALGGRTSDLVGKSLEGMRDLVTRSLAEVRLEVGAPQRERVVVATLFEDIEISMLAMAKARKVRLLLIPGALGLAVEGDSQIVAAILTNLVQNACKFTRAGSQVTLRTRVMSDRVLIDVADECGGLPPGKIEDLFRPYEQRGVDRSGLGLGLALSRKAARAIGATLGVRDVPGTGCVFTLELHKYATATASVPLTS